MAVIALLRMYGYTDEEQYRKKAEQTLELLAGAAGQYGLFAATYGIAAVHFASPHEQIVIVGSDKAAEELYLEAASSPLFGRTVLKLNPGQAVASNLPPALAATIPQLAHSEPERSVAIVCSGSTCKPPAYSAGELRELLHSAVPAA